jgi:hypothetical protein
LQRFRACHHSGLFSVRADHPQLRRADLFIAPDALG